MKCRPFNRKFGRFEGVFPGFPPSKTNIPSINSKLNLLILAIDSLSRAAFERFLPRTAKILKDKLKAAIFDKYSIVGDGTPPGTLIILI